MADVITTLDLLTLAQEYRGDIVRTVNRKAALLRSISVVVGSGKNIAWAPEYDGALVENYADGADASNFGQDTQDSAILNWSLYRSNVHISQLSMDAAATSSSPMGNRALWARAVQNGGMALVKHVNEKCYSGAGTGTTVAGLAVAIEDDNTYATIDRTDSANAKFRSTVVDPGVATAPTFALLRDDIRQVEEACGEQPNIALCKPAVFNKVASLFDATRRYTQQVEFDGPRGQIKLDLGVQALEVDGTMFMKDVDATANAIYYLNSDYVHLEVLPHAEMREWMAAGVLDFAPEDGFGPMPLMFHAEALAKAGASEKCQILWTGQLVVRRPNACGKRLNVSTS